METGARRLAGKQVARGKKSRRIVQSIERSCDVVDLLGKGLTQSQVAAELDISKQAVHKHWLKWLERVAERYSAKVDAARAQMELHRRYLWNRCIEIITDPKTDQEIRVRAIVAAEKVLTGTERLYGLTTTAANGRMPARETPDMSTIPDGLRESLERALGVNVIDVTPTPTDRGAAAKERHDE